MQKTSALRIRLAPDLHEEFLMICKQQDVPGSQVIRELMKGYVNEHKAMMQIDLFNESKEVKNER